MCAALLDRHLTIAAVVHLHLIERLAALLRRELQAQRAAELDHLGLCARQQQQSQNGGQLSAFGWQGEASSPAGAVSERAQMAPVAPAAGVHHVVDAGSPSR